MPDIFTFGIPFFFMLAVVFGALEVGGVFQNRGVKIVISLAIAFFAATFEPAVGFIFGILPYATIFFIIVFFIGFVKKIFTKEGGAKDWTIIAVILILFLILLISAEELTGISFGEQATIFIYAIGLIVILMIFYAAYQKTTGP